VFQTYVLKNKYGTVKTFLNSLNKNIKVTWKDVDAASFEDMRREALEVMRCRYKIHLQINPNYFIFFTKNFIDFVKNNVALHNIFRLDVAKGYKTGKNKAPKYTMATIVTHVALIPGSKEEKNRELYKIIDAIVENYKHSAEVIAFPVSPSFSYKINGFLSVSAGEERDKLALKFLHKQRFGYRDGFRTLLLYTPNPGKYCFTKFEFWHKKRLEENNVVGYGKGDQHDGGNCIIL
jgi:hypothetical protein